METFHGTGVAIVTPFKADQTLDLKALRKVVNQCIDGGIDYLVVLGTTGEAATLDWEEKRAVMDTVVDENSGRVPLVIGVGGNNTAAVANELERENLKDFDAVLSVSPYYNRPSQEGIFQHFQRLAHVSSIPIIIYNVPGRTASNILPETVTRIANECPGVIGIKEASGDMVQVQKVIKSVPSDFLVISGDDFTALPTVLAGGAGVISVLAQAVPREFSKMISLGMKGQDKEAYSIHQKLRRGMDLIFEEGNPSGVKSMLTYQKLIQDTVRLPLTPVSDELRTRIGDFVDSLEKMPA